jgi:plasmid stabilization system protein ParE
LDQRSLDYFIRRERAERAAAKHATCDAARRVHQEMAAAYANLAQGSGSGSGRERLVDNPIEVAAAGEARV